MRSTLLAAFALFLVIGCASPSAPPNPGTQYPAQPAAVHVSGTAKPNASSENGVIVTPDPSVSGRVALVNPNAKYMVVSFPIGALPASGQVMSVYRNGLKVGEIKITNLQKDFDAVADIVQGSGQVGDEVRQN